MTTQINRNLPGWVLEPPSKAAKQDALQSKASPGYNPAGALGQSAESGTNSRANSGTPPQGQVACAPPAQPHPQGASSASSTSSASVTAAQPAPCPRCQSGCFWRDQYNRLRCQACDQPRDLRWVRGLYVLVPGSTAPAPGSAAAPGGPWTLEELPRLGSAPGQPDHLPQGVGGVTSGRSVTSSSVSRRFTVEGDGPAIDGVWVERLEPAALHPWGAKLKRDEGGRVISDQVVRVLERVA